MPAFSLTDAAFEGFRLTRERPRVVGAWALLYAAMSLITAIVMVSTIGPEFATLRAAAAAQHGGSTDPAESIRLAQRLAPFFLMIFPFVLVFWGVLTCAIYRVVLRPEMGGFGSLRLGADELRMIGLTIVLWLMMFATVFISTLVITVGTMLAASSGPLGGLLGNLISLAAIVAVIVFWLRMSLSGPITFMSGEIHVFRSWSLTRGHVWRIAGAYGLAAMLAVVVSLLALVIFTAAAGVFVTLSGRPLTDVGTLFEANVTSLATYFTPAQIVYQAFWSVLQVVVYAVLLSPAAVIYAALSGRPVNV